ncbi:MAG TPA: GntR family transcriptional regulator [Acetobacteraceae bacterium]|nr:GntR family transcriptional regulator [Acetobacteraceae bacterium]
MSADGDRFDGLTSAEEGTPGDRLNLDDHIYERLRTMIAKGELLPGERIVPEQLAAKMGVSRTPIISALKRLAQEQVLEWRSRRGVHVRRLTPRELALVFEVREVLEGLAARRAASLVTPRQIDQLSGLFNDIDTTESPASRHHYIRQDYLFHIGLFRIADSAPLFRTMESVNIMVMAFSGGLLRPMRDVLEEHEAILEALAKQDPDAAEAAARAHIHRSVEWLQHQAQSFENSQLHFHREPLGDAFPP